ncbi:TetR/AcrR family transcriptional regulator [Sphingobacterium pedocola]|uniref:HTH tetR-type domain-containing protein n=1 Tax=Sphingobacterium pedocola TaxID=2082722 RepID=A0ABR9T698_9SPHI|nr:TetR/AcrR family transcriptional regulator [Sphingobacterium pedocola]MBE8720868.1 hypothetical protein [Sphingobacterium pedocola]
MDTRDKILEVTAELVMRDGYNAFSYKDISKKIGIKTSSIHYHFPTKSDLILSLLQDACVKQNEIISAVEASTPLKKLDVFMDFYLSLARQGKICLVVALLSDINSMDSRVKDELKSFYELLINWLQSILEDGLKREQMVFATTPLIKATEIMSAVAMIPILSRIGTDQSFEQIVESIKNSIINN